ncbi:unnamed protein product, partial [Onchocerca ochengi]|uniref:ANK_REP_REGION domain-containing protein n=1 Tax=Onchocerca ochengi TaxID=42157 RepID=A0A182ERJ1_ONCOC
MSGKEDNIIIQSNWCGHLFCDYGPSTSLHTIQEPKKYFMSRIHKAAYASCLNCCKRLIEFECCDPNTQAYDGATPLLLICSALRTKIKQSIEKEYELAKYFLESGANPNIKDYDGNEPLQQAIKSRNYKLIKLLIEYGANEINLSDGMGWLLREATKKMDMSMIQKFVKWGCNIFDTDEDGYTPLLIATKKNFYDGVKWFLKKAGKRAIELVNIQAKDKTTCVMTASTAGYARILELLIEYGANCNIIGSLAWFPGKIHPIASAALNNHPKCIELLLPHVNREVLKETIDPILAAASNDSYDSIALLIKSGYSVEVPSYRVEEIGMLAPYTMPLFTRRYCTALREAEWRQNTSIVELLIKAGAKMTYTSKCFSPFLFALWRHSRLDILFQFLQNDVDINAM